VIPARRRCSRGLTAAALAGLLMILAVGCGSATDDRERGSAPQASQPVNAAKVRAKARAKRIAARQEAALEHRRARAAVRRQARRARANARRAASKARAAERRIKVRARALARSGGDVDCGSFVSQARAQLYLLPDDPFRLDADSDGVACADLPCPCSTAAGREPGSTDSGGGEVTTEPPRRFTGTVTHVADGDTLDVSTPSGSVETVRIIGIDTPEVYGGKECGGPVASAAMKRMATGQRVTVTSDPTQDRRDHYGRLLAYIDKGNQDLGYTMVKRGLASAYPYDGPFQRYPRYEKADRRARNQGTGSWSNCDISPG